MTEAAAHAEPEAAATGRYLESLPAFTGSGEFTLDPMIRLLQACGDPHLRLPPVVHVTGTNGKGSVVAHVCDLFAAAGIRTAAFTSPHAPPDFARHLSVNGRPCAPAVFAGAVEEVRCGLQAAAAAAALEREDDDAPILPPHLEYLRRLGAVKDGPETPQDPSQFEVVTAACFAAAARLFAEGEIEVFVVEVGLGGRVDCTNVVPPPAAAVFASVHKDHTGILGDTVREIAREKSGIVKPGTRRIFSYPHEDPAGLEEIRAAAAAAGTWVASPSWVAAGCGEVCVAEVNADAAAAATAERPAPHQLLNFALARAAACAVFADALERDLSPERAAEAARYLRSEAAAAAYVPLRTDSCLSEGRYELWEGGPEGLEVVLDGAHNPQAVRGLRDCLAAAEGGPRGGPSSLTVVAGVMKDKDVDAIAATYASFHGGEAAFFLLAPPPPRGLDAAAFAARLMAAGVDGGRILAPSPQQQAAQEAGATLRAALAHARKQAPRRTTLLITGSFYLLNTAREFLCQALPELKRRR